MDNVTSIIKSKLPLTPFQFYSDFLLTVAKIYQEKPTEVLFKLFENGDDKIFDSEYRIDPITIPLLLSLLEQLRKFHKQPLKLLLYNNNATVPVLEFLYRADFFNVAGNNKNSFFPLGRNIVEFDEKYLGAFSGKSQRKEHRVRAYSIHDDNLEEQLKVYESEEEIRDYLNSHLHIKLKSISVNCYLTMNIHHNSTIRLLIFFLN